MAGRARTALAGVCVLLAGLAAAACDAVLPRRDMGQTLWRGRCATCHGIDAAGNTPRFMGNAAADLRDDSWRHIAGGSGEIAQIVRQGIPGVMPANPDLTEAQVQALVTHLRRLRGEPVQTP